MSQVADHTGMLGEIRDALARPFGEAMGAHVPQVIDLLEQQLALAEDRSRWKPLKGAVELLKGLRSTLGPRVTKEVASRFDAKVDPDQNAFGKTARFSMDSLSLVADDQVQEEIALGNTTKRLKEQVGDELFALVGATAADGPMFGEGGIEVHEPLRIGATYTVGGSLTSVVRKEGRKAGVFDIVAFRIELRDDRGELAAVSTNSFIFPRRD